MGFDPNTYKEPVKSNYLDLQDGANTIRLLVDTKSDQMKIGYEYWTMQNVDGVMKPRPTRVAEDAPLPMDEIVTNKFGNLNYSFFWAMPVYSFENEKIMIWCVKQATIRKAMIATIKNAKWGNPTAYNFQVVKEKDKDGKTTYTVTPEPKEKLETKIILDFNKLNLNMDTWMAGKDPFEVKGNAVKIADEVAAGLEAEKVFGGK